MNTVHRGILTLIRSALTGEKLELPCDFTLEQADKLIQKHSLLPMAYQGAYHCGIPQDSEMMQRYYARYYRVLVHCERQMDAVEKIFAAFDDNGIDFLPLKGSAIRDLYPKCEFRPMSDSDILIRNQQYEKVRAVMSSLGYQEGSESDHDYTWSSEALRVEIHKCLFSDQNPDFQNYFGDGWNKLRVVRGYRYGLTQEDEYLYLFSHMMKHFLLAGIGVTHLTDLYIYRKTHPTMDEAKIESVLKRMHLLELYRNIRRMLLVWFEDQPEDPVSEVITDFVFSSGNFGTTFNKIYAEEALRTGSVENKRNSKEKAFFRLLFQPLWLMRRSYKVLYKAPFLLPLFWVVRWIEVLLLRRKNIGKKMSVVRNMSDDKVEEYARIMQYMGVDLRYQSK